MALRPVEFHILLTLAGEERHGYAILQEVADLTDGELEIEPGTLYRALPRMLRAAWGAGAAARAAGGTAAGAGPLSRALHRMLRDGGVVESARRPAVDMDDERRRYYRITPA